MTMTSSDAVMIGSDGSIARQDPELRRYDQWLLVWIGPKIRGMLAEVAGREVAAVHMVAADEVLFTEPHGVRWREVHPQVLPAGLGQR
jgi:hypothetical protein